jgi:hypothetical protein
VKRRQRNLLAKQERELNSQLGKNLSSTTDVSSIALLEIQKQEEEEQEVTQKKKRIGKNVLKV